MDASSPQLPFPRSVSPHVFPIWRPFPKGDTSAGALTGSPPGVEPAPKGDTSRGGRNDGLRCKTLGPVTDAASDDRAFHSTLKRLKRQHRLDVEPTAYGVVGCPDPTGWAGAPEPAQRWAAAHLAAHVSLKHDSDLPVYAKAANLGAAVMFGASVVLVAFAMPVWQPAVWVAVAAIVFALGLTYFAGWFTAKRRRPMELEADQQAAQWGFPVGQTVVGALKARESKNARRWPVAPLRRSPLPEERLNAH